MYELLRFAVPASRWSYASCQRYFSVPDGCLRHGGALLLLWWIDWLFRQSRSARVDVWVDILRSPTLEMKLSGALLVRKECKCDFIQERDSWLEEMINGVRYLSL